MVCPITQGDHKKPAEEEIMPDSVCGMGLACTWRTARLASIADVMNCEVV